MANSDGNVIKLGIVQFLIATSPAFAEPVSFSTYGTPGLVELPTAEVLNDGELAFTSSYFAGNFRNTAVFQVFPRVYGTFRYATVDDFNVEGLTLFDRSFDIHFQLLTETERSPALAVGVRDFLGTGTFSSEYLAATKHFGPDIKATVGLGWGRLAGRNSFSNPLSVFDDRFNTRPDQDIEARRANLGGQVESSSLFRGPTALFGGIDWQASENLSFQIEYSPDIYELESIVSGSTRQSPINASIDYRFNDNLDFKAFVIGGEDFGAQLSFQFDPASPVIKGGREPAPRPIAQRASLAVASWLQDGAVATENEVGARLGAEGMTLEGMSLSADAVTVNLMNNRWDNEAQAAGRAARVLANTLPPSVETFTLIFQEQGLPLSSITTQRSDIEELQFDYDGAWKSFVRANIESAAQQGVATPKFTYSITPYTAFSFFDPQEPIRIDIGPQLELSYSPEPGLSFNGLFRYPIAGNLGDAVRESDSVLPRVRSEAFLFARESDFEINRVTAEYLWRPSSNTFARVTGGYLEDQFGGVSAEMLWSPINSRLALGAELNYVKQRDFDMLLGFQDYDVVTGHASAYYDFDNDFHAQVDLGRYLAGDWGGTLTINREFNNGIKIGGYFTLTDVPFEDFGEGSFDKGLTLEIPLSFVTGQPTRRTLNQRIQPLLRDGGARLKVENRLNPLVRDYRGVELADSWGNYLR